MMIEELIIRVMATALILILKITMPILTVTLFVGLSVGIFQATTQIQEMTLSFIPKLLSIFLVMFFLGHWMLVNLIEYTKDLFKLIIELK